MKKDSQNRDDIDLPQKKFRLGKKNNLSVPIILFLVTIVAGAGLVQFLERIGMLYLKNVSENTMTAVANALEDEMHHIQSAAGSMAGAPWSLPAVLSPNEENLKKANAALDRYRANFDFSVCYLLDHKGTTLATSNRNDPDSFLGKNYAFRPYFQEPMRGKATVYLAQGITNRERGIYVGYPVKDVQGKILGAVVIKKKVFEIDNLLLGHPHFFYVSPEGIIFLSSNKEVIFKALWPLTSEQEQGLEKSRQFPKGSFETMLSRMPQDGDILSILGTRSLCFRKFVGPEGWSLVLCMPFQPVVYFRLFGVIIVAFSVTILVILLLWASMRNRTLDLLRESDLRFRGAFESAAIGMALVGLEGRWLKVNQAICRIVGYSAEELLTKTFQDITHSEDLPKDLENIRQLVNGEIQDYRMEKRYFHKKGHVVWVLLAVSLVRDPQGKPLYFISQIEDITDRKAAEEQLNNKIEELQRFNKIAVGRELKMIELKEQLKNYEQNQKGMG